MGTLREAAKALPFPEAVTRFGGEVKGHRVLCPFHKDHRASMVVYQDHGYCFACQKSCDSIEWVERTQGLEFTEACKTLLAAFGLPNPEEAQSEQELRAAMEATRALQAEREEAEQMYASITRMSAVLSRWRWHYEPQRGMFGRIKPLDTRFVLAVHNVDWLDALLAEYENIHDPVARRAWLLSCRASKRLYDLGRTLKTEEEK